MKATDLQLLQELVENAVKSAVPEAVEPAIKKYVNGKIDRLSEKVDEHNIRHEADMQELKPFIQGVAGAKILGSGLKWIAGIAIAYMTIKSIVTGVPF